MEVVNEVARMGKGGYLNRDPASPVYKRDQLIW